MELILASASPRRQELLQQLGIKFRVVPSTVDERAVGPMGPAVLVEHLASIKAEDVARQSPGALVLGADTVVVVDGDVLGKPGNREDAIAMLERLSGRSHRVMTGVALVLGDRRLVAHEETEVRFRQVELAVIERYVDSGEPMDKAGAYAIQGRAGGMISGIDGDYFNVVGLPLSRTVQMLGQFGIAVL